VRSSSGAELTVIAPSILGPAIRFSSGSTAAAVLDGFTVRGADNGYDSPFPPFGGGIQVDGSSPVIKNCLVLGNKAFLGGGIGIINHGAPLIVNCTVSGNVAHIGSSYGMGFGGGICSYESSATITRCIVVGNTASGMLGTGGGIGVYAGAIMITDSIVTGNSSTNPGSITVYNSTVAMTNCTVSKNEPWGGLYESGASSSVTATNCIFWGDLPQQIMLESGSLSVTHSNVQGGWPGTGNIDTIPLFVDPDNGDFRLKDESPCIDVGDNSVPNLPGTDLDGQPRVADGNCDGEAIVDMGAYEFVKECGYSAVPNAEASIYGDRSLTASGSFNALALLLIPTGAVIGLRIMRRRK